MPARERARRLAVVSDASPILFSYTCLEIVLMGRTPYKGRLELDRPEDEALARESLERAGAAGLAEKRIDAISSGERQKVLLAAALCQEPKVLLMDEPTVHLDVRAEREVFAVVDALRRERGIAVIAVLHDLHRAARSCDRVLFLRGGRAVAAGRPDDVMTPPTLERVYGVRLGRFEREGKIYFD
jgi:iron complex transport system ATP-binding protein